MEQNKTLTELGDSVRFEGDERRKISPSDEAFDSQFEQKSVYVKSGETCWLEGDEQMLVATVGTGIVLSIFEERLKFGVLSHFVLSPQMAGLFPNFNSADPDCVQEVCAPIENAVKEMKKHGAGKKRIRVRLFGGAEMSDDDPDMGLKNYVFIKECLARRGLTVMSEDIGGKALRRVHFFPYSGAVNRFILRRKEDLQRVSREHGEYFSDLNK